MKNSGVEWIGEIPEDWEVKPVKRYFSHVKRIVGDDVDKYERLSLTMQGVLKRSKDDAEGLQPEKFNGYQILKQNELVFKLIDLENVNTSRVGISPFNGLVSPAYIILTNNKKDNTFYYYWFLNMYYQEIFNKLGDGGVRSALNASDVLSLTMVYLNNETQQRIATYLDKKCSKIEETIQNQQQVIEKLKAYKQSLITEAVTGKVKIANGKVCGEYESYKDSGVEWIGKIPSGWEVKKLKFSSQIMRGLFSHRPRNDLDYYDGVHPFIQTGEVARAVKYITTYSQTLNELGFSVSREFPAGTVLLTIAANVGDVAILDFNACFPDSVIGFYPKENVSKIFMFYVLKSMKEQFMRNAIISTQMNLNINIVKEEFIPLPSLDEQKEIVKFLEKKSDYIDTVIEQKQNLIEKLTEYKKSLIYECVTGKKEI